MPIQLREYTETRKEVSVKFVKPALYASKCEACGKVFKMGDGLNKPKDPYRNFGTLTGMFDRCAIDSITDKSLGNGFHAEVCSFTCAQKIMDGGWQELKEWKPFVRQGAKLIRCELEIHTAVKTEAELIAEWEAAEPYVAASQSGARGIILD
jgi:hypothetical protein